MSSRPPAIRPDRLGISTGSNVPSRSLGAAMVTGPIPVCTIFGLVPFRELPLPCPAGSCRS